MDYLKLDVIMLDYKMEAFVLLILQLMMLIYNVIIEFVQMLLLVIRQILFVEVGYLHAQLKLIKQVVLMNQMIVLR